MIKIMLVFCCYTGLFLHAQSNEAPFLSVNGSGQITVKATLSDVRLGLEVEGTAVKNVMDKLTSRLDPVLAALKKMEPLKLETGAINVNPEYNKESPPKIVGYKGTVEILFTKEANKAGELIDAALNAGANKLDGVSLRPTDETLDNARITSLQKACQNALEEADIVMKALNLTAKGIKEVEIQSGNHLGPIPLTFSNQKYMRASVGNALQILDQEQTVNASVSVKLFLSQRNK